MVVVCVYFYVGMFGILGSLFFFIMDDWFFSSFLFYEGFICEWSLRFIFCREVFCLGFSYIFLSIFSVIWSRDCVVSSWVVLGMGWSVWGI